MGVLKQGELWLKMPFSLSATSLNFPGREVLLKDVVECEWVGLEFTVSTGSETLAIRASSLNERVEWTTTLQSYVTTARSRRTSATTTDEDNEPLPSSTSVRSTSPGDHATNGIDSLDSSRPQGAPETFTVWASPGGDVKGQVAADPKGMAWLQRSSADKLLNAAAAGLLAARPKCPTGYLAQMFSTLLSQRLEKNAENSSYESDQWHWYIYAAEKKLDSMGGKPDAGTREEIFKDIASEAKCCFTSFIPDILMKAITDGKVSDEVVDYSPTAEMRNPMIGSVKGVVVFADASGFTFTTERLTLQPHGAERLGKFLNSFFGSLIDIVKSWGGDIIKFSGDAITILFPVETEGQEVEAPLAAACCCQAIHKNLSNYPTPVKDVVFNFHIGIGFGECALLEVGGVLHRFEFCAVGPPFLQLAVAEPTAAPGQTCASPEFLAEYWKACEHFEVQKEEEQETNVAGYKILGKIVEAPPAPPAKAPLPDVDMKILKKYIPASGLRQLIFDLRIGQMAGFHVDTAREEMRKVTVVFLSIDSKRVDVTTAEGAKKLQLLVTCCQRSCYTLEGSVNKFMMDDKGILLLTVFGLPPMSHFDDDPLRATLAARRMVDSVQEQGLVARAGIATGIVWSGMLGNLTRREYTVLGNVVNLSARLMANAQAGGLLCDQDTQRALELLSFEVQPLQPIVMKGKTAPVPIFCPTGRMLKKWSRPKVPDISAMCPSITGATHQFWMRCEQAERLQECVTEQLKQGGGVTFVTGKADTGKGEVLERLHYMKEGVPGMESGFRLLHGSSLDPTKTHIVELQVWQQVFDQVSQLLMCDADLIEEARQKTGLPCTSLRSLLQSSLSEEAVKLLPLLATLMTGLQFNHFLVDAAIDSNTRHNSGYLDKIFIEVLELVSRHHQTVILLHLEGSSSIYKRFDPRTFRLARALVQHIMTKRRRSTNEPNDKSVLDGFGLALVICGRDSITELESIKERASSLDALIEVKTFGEAGTGEFFRHCLALSSKHAQLDYDLPPELLHWIMSMTRGNARLIKAMAQGCWDKGIATIEDGRWVFRASPDQESPTLQTFLHTEIFEGVLSVALTQFDRLTAAEQNALTVVAASKLEAWTEEQMKILGNLGPALEDAVSLVILSLVKKDWLVKVSKKLLVDPTVECYTFAAAFLRQAVELTVLQAQVEQLAERKAAHGMEGIRILRDSAPTWVLNRCTSLFSLE